MGWNIDTDIDLADCEEVLIDNDYILIRPDEKIVLIDVNGKFFLIFSSDDVHKIFKDIVDAENPIEHIRENYYSVEISATIRIKENENGDVLCVV